jgi:hypothetical protein
MPQLDAEEFSEWVRETIAEWLDGYCGEKPQWKVKLTDHRDGELDFECEPWPPYVEHGEKFIAFRVTVDVVEIAEVPQTHASN